MRERYGDDPPFPVYAYTSKGPYIMQDAGFQYRKFRLKGTWLMGFPSLEQALNKVSNRYMLVVLASKRARQINRGSAARVASKHHKPTSMALEEIAAAKLEYRVKEEGETAKA